MRNRYSRIGIGLAVSAAAIVGVLAMRPLMPCWVANAISPSAMAGTCKKGKCFCFKNGKAKCRKCDKC
jgi:hypothetical protein